jgi:hypothetical protein
LRKALLFLQQLHTLKGIYEGQNVVNKDMMMVMTELKGANKTLRKENKKKLGSTVRKEERERKKKRQKHRRLTIKQKMQKNTFYFRITKFLC